MINEEEFSELVRSFQIYNEDEIDDKIFNFLSKIDVFDNQKITFSECISFFQTEPIGIENNNNFNKDEETILERICFGEKNHLNNSEISGISKKNFVSKNEFEIVNY